jgi:glycosyltransferase involved in cell wall biosynthesis
VSIVTVVYCGAATLERTIHSVLKQEYKPIEYIIVDGASTDGTVDIIRRADDRIDYWISEPDDGIYEAMNKGIALATGSIIGLLNSDDWYLEGAISAIVDLAAAEPDADILYGEVVMGRLESPTIFAGAELPLRARDFCGGQPVPHPAMFVRRTCYERNGVYRPNFRIAADFDLILRNYQAGTKFARIHRPLVVMAFGGISRREVMGTLAEVSRVLRVSGMGWRIRLCHSWVVVRSKVLGHLRASRLLLRFYHGGRSLFRKVGGRR